MKRALLIHIILSWCTISHAQITSDSAQLLFDEIYGIELSQPEEAIKRYQKVILSFEESVDKGRAFSYIGMVHLAQGRYDSLEYYMDAALDIFEEEEYDRGIASVFNTLGNANLYRGFYTQALGQYQRALPFYEQPGQEYNHTVILNNMAAMFQHNGDYELAFTYLRKALNIAKQLNDQKALANSYNNLSAGYMQINDFEQAYQYADSAVTYIQDLTEDKLELLMACNLIKSCVNTQRIEKAERLLAYIKSRVTTIDDIETTITFQQSSALLALEKGNYSSAITQAQNALLQLAQFKDRRYEEETLRILYQAQKQQGSLRDALDTHEKIAQTKEESYMNAKNIRVRELETIYQNNQKEKQLLRQQLQLEGSSSRIRLLSALSISLCVLGFVIWRFLTKRKHAAEVQLALQSEKLKTLEKEKQIASLDYILQGQENERKRIAQDLHDGLGGLLTAVRRKISHLQSAINDLTEMEVIKETEALVENACDEVRRISHDMMPATLTSLGLEDAIEDLIDDVLPSPIKFDFTYQLNKESISDKVKIHIYRITQEIITNAIKHSEISQIELVIKTDGSDILFDYSDDSSGFEFYDIQERSGLGLTGIITRVKLLRGTILYLPSGDPAYRFKIPLA